MDLMLKDKVFIVTGGSKGIGEGVSRSLAAEGAIPVIASRSVAASEQLVKELLATGRSASFIAGDLAEPSQCQAVVEQTISRFGRIDGIVNNAGVNDGVGLENGSPEGFLSSLHKNLLHYYSLVHFALPYLKESRGAIVNISSKVALTGQGQTSGYAAAKGAQLALAREWAAELLPYGIRVNAVLPAEVLTPLYENWLNTAFDDPEAKRKEITGKIPLEKRMTTKAEIADMVVFLLSARSSHTTGQWIIVDGGYVHLDRSLT
ncbi:MAG: SDR family oxidoreductase [Lewinellaceae bacterium]|nr:SDR family oxidoreductase [Phaeodactylibacter sp.]MCB0613806.1 SDR family oxidoreductase [Phaeodactylibacter sp.]MCB9349739.1 SDR family oxidoreductase [Lewinellaceae bacterium]MCB9352738.1 SDR family oxidoreductase [Lewinellaceae bacterium]